MKANIVFFIQNFSRAGGSERAVSLVANELAERGYNIAILSICGGNTCFFDLNKNIKLYTLMSVNEVNNRKKFLKILRELKFFYKNHHVDICVDVFASLSIYTLLIKIKYGFKNITWEHYNYLNNMGLNKIGRQLAIRFSDAIVTLTKTDKNHYLENNKCLNNNKIFSIFNATPYPNALYNAHRDKVIISIGRLEKLKGFDQLLDVWSKICVKYPDWKLQIIGEGEEWANLQEMINENDIKNVELLGKRRDVEKFYQTASIYVSTSEKEGLPMTMIEAQSFGVPIVSFDYETGPKDIITEGKDGFIISQGENRNSNMAKKIAELIDDPLKLNKMCKSAKLGSERFDIEIITNEWEKVIVGLLEGKTDKI